MAFDPVATTVPQQFAFLNADGRTYAAVSRPDSPLRSSAAANLLQAIWFHFPNDARRIVRNRIQTTESENAMAQGFKKIVGKRIAFESSEARELQTKIPPDSTAFQILEFDETRSLDATRIPLDRFSNLAAAKNPKDLAGFLEKIAGEGPLSVNRYENPRQVAAALVSLDGEILLAHRNGNQKDRSLHAELQICRDWWAIKHSPLPAASRLIVSLQCCQMCAAALLSLSPGAGFKVHYLKAETGPGSANSVLKLHGLEQKIP